MTKQTRLIRWHQLKKKAFLPKPYWKRLLVWLDQGVNVLLSPVLNIYLPPGAYRFGYEDETLSSVFAKNSRHHQVKWCCVMCKLLNLFDQDHCTKNIELDEGDQQQ